MGVDFSLSSEGERGREQRSMDGSTIEKKKEKKDLVRWSKGTERRRERGGGGRGGGEKEENRVYEK